jgi:hypothetical protein
MSEILSNIVVQQVNATFTSDPTQLNISPEAINLNYFGGGLGVPGGNVGELQYNAGSVLAGTPNLTYNSNTGATSITSLISTDLNVSNITISNVANLGSINDVVISGGTSGQVLTTDGAGNLSFTTLYSNAIINGTSNVNISSLNGNVTVGVNGTANALVVKTTGITSPAVTTSNITANGDVALGSVSNVHITGGTNGYFLQTDGAGNLSWTTGGGSGNGVVGGSNTQVQFNDSGSFGGDANFLFDKSTSELFVNNANIANITANLISGNITTDSQPNITSLGVLSSLSVSGTTSIYAGIENVELISVQSGNCNFNMLDGSIQYTTANATGNIILNFRGSSSVTANSMISVGKAVTSSYLMQTGATPYGITGIQIDGANTTIGWAGNLIPPFQPNAIQSYTFTLIKTSTSPTYSVLGSMTRYG